MVTLYFVLFLVAVILFVLAAFQVHAAKLNLLALGLAFGFAVPCLQMLQRL